MEKQYLSGALSSLAALAFTSMAQAALVAVGVNGTQSAFTSAISGSDLLHGLTPTTTGTISFDTNGIYDGAYTASSSSTTGGLSYLNTDGGVTMTFDLTGSVTGYDITSIVSFAGWNSNAHHHAAQFYEVLVSVVGSPTYNTLSLTGTPTSAGKVSYDPFSSSADGGTRVTITEDGAGAVIASGVDGIRFIFNNAPNGLENNTVYQEVDVFGTATPVPEPSAALLGGLGILALLRRRR
jgi:hypothetical protein